MKSQQYANNSISLGTRNARNDMIALGSPNVALWVLGKGYLVPATSSPLALQAGESDVQLQWQPRGLSALRPRPSWTVANMNPWYQKLGGFSEVPLLCFAFQNNNTQPHGKRLKTHQNYHLSKKLPEKNNSWNPQITFPSQSCHAIGTHNLETLQLPGAELSGFSGPSYVCQNYFKRFKTLETP